MSNLKPGLQGRAVRRKANDQPNPRIHELCALLKLAHTKDTLHELASDNSLSHEDYLLEILTAEYENRLNNGIARRLKEAKFPYKKYLVDFNKTKYPEELTQEFEELETLEFIREKENIILIGTSGAGKTHLAIALGIAACMAGETVYFATVSNLMIELKEAMSNMQITRFRQKFERYSLVILDELGYVTFDKSNADLLFNLISSPNHKGSIIVTTNLTFDRWEEVFHRNFFQKNAKSPVNMRLTGLFAISQVRLQQYHQ